jgi:hypothetical protein
MSFDKTTTLHAIRPSRTRTMVRMSNKQIEQTLVAVTIICYIFGGIDKYVCRPASQRKNTRARQTHASALRSFTIIIT